MGIDGKRLRALREERGLYLQNVADYLGITRQAYMKYESGETKNPRQIEKLARFFNVTTDYLLGNDKNNDLPPLTPRDERNIAKEIEKILDGLDNSAALGGSIITDDEDLELLKSSLTQAVTLAKRVAKQKFTPKKYRKE